MPFRFNARNAFLTYPRCEHSPNALGEFLRDMRPTKYIHVVRERHEDGTPHLHVLVQWVDKFNCRDPRKFDYLGNHPNLQPCRDVAAVEDYITKSLSQDARATDEFIHGTISRTNEDSKWRKVAEAISEDDVLKAALEASARDFVIHHDRIREYARSRRRSRIPYSPRTGDTFRIPESLAQYMVTEFTNPVGLCPSLLTTRSFISHNIERIVLEPSCLSGQHEVEKHPGQEASDIIITGGACPICLLSTHPLHI